MLYRDHFGDVVELTDERWNHIVKEHPEMHPYLERIPGVLSDPDYVKRSRRDDVVWLYYRRYTDLFEGKFLLVVVKKGARPFILTATSPTESRRETLYGKDHEDDL